MDERKTDIRGITLVALIITVVILLILAGITISQLAGENGLFARAKEAKNNYAISEEKEKLELAIMNLRIDVEGKGEKLTKEKLLQLNSDEIDVKSTESFPVEAICTKYKFDIDANYNVTYKGENNGIKVVYTIEPEGYTNQDEIKILIKVTSPKGVKAIQYPDGNILNVNGEKEVETYYIVNKNGEYNFIIIDNANSEETRKVHIEQIDKLAPKDFKPDAVPGSGSVTITCNVEDEDATEESCKSGIDYYEYYIKKSTDTNYPIIPSESNIITGLEPGTYNICAIAYDKAGNKKQSQEIEVIITIKISKASTTTTSSFVIDESGNLWGWGYLNGYVAGGSNGKEKIIMNNEVKFKEVEANNDRCLALDNEGNIWAFGNNAFGQLGDGTTNDSKELKKIVIDTKFIKIACGNGSSFAIDIAGNIWAWGSNMNGLELGTGKYGDESIPVRITTNVKFKEISSGQGYTLALDEDGNLWSWGNNIYGKLCDSGKTNKNVPTKVDNGIKYKEISAGYNCSLLIDENNTLWGCGYNEGGFGDSIRESLVPKKIKEEIKFIKAVSISNKDCFAIDENGNLWSWGVNKYGELGSGSNNTTYTPEIRKKEIKFKDIVMGDSGYEHVLAIDESGVLWGCGSNFRGVIGNATTSTSDSAYTGKFEKVF